MEHDSVLTDHLDSDTLEPMNRRKIKGTWGGWRPGSGRKPVFKDRVLRTFSLERSENDSLEAIAHRRGISVAEVIREAVQAHLKRQKRTR
jgi:hypothetical protein